MNNFSRRQVLKGALASVAVGTLGSSLTACGGSDSSSSSSGSAGSGGGATLTYWASNQGTSLDNDKEVLTPVLAAFEKATGNKVNLEVIGWSDLQTRIQTAVTSGNGPDVLNIGNTWAVSLQATGAFLELGDEEMKALGGADKFVKAALDTGGAPDSKPTSVPLYGLAYGLYYNKAMFKAAGLQPPTTWEELENCAKKLTDTAKGVYGMSLAAGSYTENCHFAFITATQNGAALFDSAGKPTFTQDGVVNGVLRYLDLMQKDKAVNPSNAQYDNGTKSVTDFAKGKAAMILNQNNADATILSNGMTRDQFGVVALPAPASSADKTASMIAGINMSIMGNTKNKDAALAFVKYMTDKDTQATLGKPFSCLPVLKDGTATFTTDAAELKTFTEIYNTRSKPLPLVSSEDQFESNVGKAINNMFAKIATGGTVSAADIKSALQTAQDAIQ